jgi:phage FluMu protein gp41
MGCLGASGDSDRNPAASDERGLQPSAAQVAQSPVQVKLLLRQHGQLGVVAAPLSFRNLCSQVSDFALDPAFLEARNGALNRIRRRRSGLTHQDFG